MKVEQYLKKYNRSLTDFQEKNWKDKIIITEKAVIKSKIKEHRTRCKAPVSYEYEVNKAVEDTSDTARVDEGVVEKLPEPPAEDADDEKAKKVKMKRPSKKRRRKKVKGIIENECRKIKFEKLGMDELLGKNLVMPKYMKNNENEEDIGSILDITEVLTKNPDASEGNEWVNEIKVEGMEAIF